MIRMMTAISLKGVNCSFCDRPPIELWYMHSFDWLNGNLLWHRWLCEQHLSILKKKTQREIELIMKKEVIM